MLPEIAIRHAQCLHTAVEKSRQIWSQYMATSSLHFSNGQPARGTRAHHENILHRPWFPGRFKRLSFIQLGAPAKKLQKGATAYDVRRLQAPARLRIYLTWAHS
jgi:hypothetical protein